MGKYSIAIEKRAQQELQDFYKSGNKAVIKKIKQIFDELEEHPQTGIGKPEQLKHNLSGYWSRRINQKDRLIYRIEEAIVTVFVISASSHYDAK
jgi:toxin YoeB